MRSLLAAAALPLLHRLDPERAHRLAVRALRLGLGGTAPADDPRLSIDILGKHFHNPIGLAAGFDKQAEALPACAGLGFGFIEAGGVTPRPQSGNPPPRLFRLDEDRAIINRFGLNSVGIAVFADRLHRDRPRIERPVGVNLGLNKEGAVAEEDFPLLARAVAADADYVSINVSSPNTPGLRDLQAGDRIAAILAAIGNAVPNAPPVLVKVAPDLADADLDAVVDACLAHGAAGMVIANTTIARPLTLRSRHAAQAGGLSGPVLMGTSTAMLARAARRSAGRLVLIGVGGIASGADILAKLRAGASLVQLYTAFVYEGPALLPRLKRELLQALGANGFRSVPEAIGTALKAPPCSI